MKPTKYILFNRRRRAARAARQAPPPPPPIVKPVVFPHTAQDEPIAKPVILPEITMVPKQKKPEVPVSRPYTKRRNGMYLCEFCGHELKTEDGIRAHIGNKHPEVRL